MNTNDLVELNVERMSFGPAAVGRMPGGDGRQIVVFIEGALPGEQVRAKLVKQHKNYWEAELVEILKASPDRRDAPCPVYDRCGGCQWQHLSYPAQLKAKEEILLHQLHRATRLSTEELKNKLTVHGAKNEFGYRSRLQAHGDKKGIGFYARHSHQIVHTESCPIAHDEVKAAWSEFLAKRPLAELSSATGQFKIEWARSPSGQVREAINRKHGAFGFTQVNWEQNEVLVSAATKAAKVSAKKTLLLDLYGGDGNLSNGLEKDFTHIVSVDSHNEGEDPANLKSLPGGRVFLREPVEDFMVNQRWRDWGFDRPDCVIVDPPRAGLYGVAKRLAALKPASLVMVSCDPSTLGRDLSEFVSGYAIKSVDLIDMFPQTYHMETVVHCRATS